jgi:hypothetical protein
MGLNAYGLYPPEFEWITPLEIEMKICTEYLHQPHSYFLSLSKEDRIKLYLYEEMQRDRQEFSNKKENRRRVAEEAKIKAGNYKRR